MAAALGTGCGSWAVVHSRGHFTELTKCECLCAVEFGALAKLVHSALAGILVFLRVHAKVVLGKAAGAVRLEEVAIATIKNVHLRVRELRVTESIKLAVLVAYEFSPT